MLIIVAAVCYYGSYLQYWFNPHDEGGTGASIAMRLLAGDTPFRDIELGYNIGWFWPIVGLFKVFGVNFLLMRGYFFGLSTLCALWGWAVARKVTRREGLALAVGIALVIFPGSQFKNYIPMLGVANMLAIVTGALGSRDSSTAFWRRVALGGLVLGFTFLIRVDLGYLFGLLWLGLIFFRLFDARIPGRSRFIDCLTTAAVLCAAAIVTHVPVYFVAKSGGYAQEFVQQYQGWAGYLSGQAESIVNQRAVSATPEALSDATTKKPQTTGNPNPSDRSTLTRVDWKTFSSFAKADKSVLFVLTYVPVLVFVLSVAWAAFGVINAIFRGTYTLDHPAMIALLLLGGSLATFPQFFFFRPDRPHLAEFMPGFIVASVSVAYLITSRFRWFIVGLLVVQFGFFAWFGFDHYSAGTIAARLTIKKKKRVFFDGANGVKVWVHESDHKELETVRRAVVEHSKPGDWLVCYPYQPGYNVMTDRPSYERELYQDNATAPGGWNKQTIRRLDEKKPAVVVIDDRAINKVEGSKFSHWAKKVYDHVREQYDLCGQVDTVEVYCRKPANADPAATPPASTP